MGSCFHKTADDHVLGGDASRRPLTWICSVCGRNFRWNGASSYKGSLECPECGRQAVETVCCDEGCRRRASVRERARR